MAIINNYEQFITRIVDKSFRPYVKRFRELAGLSPLEEEKETYLIEFTFDFGDALWEHISIKNFKKSTNRYYFHPESTNPPVKGHYHVTPLKSNHEIYAVNLDGTAHHKSSRGYEIPRKEADELRSLGVNIKPDRMIESIDILEPAKRLLLTESVGKDCVSIFIEIEV